MNSDADKERLNKRLAGKLSLIVVAGLLFGFALAPLYDVMCKAIGLNGRADTSASVVEKNLKVDKTRYVTVLFTGNTMPGLSWGFHPKENSMRVHPGEIMLTSYYAKNEGADSMIGVAVPSVSPELASLYFKKIECFCFNQQTLKSGESKEMPLRFYVSPDLPAEVNTVTLSYAFYNGTTQLSDASNTTQAKN
ncbi:MAG: cytochrome c oxidase assembly protein [Methylophilaceae bacterium]